MMILFENLFKLRQLSFALCCVLSKLRLVCELFSFTIEMTVMRDLSTFESGYIMENDNELSRLWYQWLLKLSFC